MRSLTFQHPPLRFLADWACCVFPRALAKEGLEPGVPLAVMSASGWLAAAEPLYPAGAGRILQGGREDRVACRQSYHHPVCSPGWLPQHLPGRESGSLARPRVAQSPDCCGSGWLPHNPCPRGKHGCREGWGPALRRAAAPHVPAARWVLSCVSRRLLQS